MNLLRRTILLVLLLAAAIGCGRDIQKKGDGPPANSSQNNVSTNNANNVATNNANSVATNNANNVATNNVTTNNNQPDDRDGDGVLDGDDNCPDVENREQLDTDADTVGDSCDNCPSVANVGQADDDGNGIGDSCEPGAVYDRSADTDGDGIVDVADNCRLQPDPAQTDRDGDGVGDVCDNCPETPNSDQTDSNSDGTGDSCSTVPQGMQCPVEYGALAPDMWLLIDNSGSMFDDLTEYRPGLSNFTDAHEVDTRFGVSGQQGGTCDDTLYLPLDQYSAADLRGVWNNLNPNGPSTPNVGLQMILQQSYLSDPVDPYTDRREKIVAMMTDSPPNTCEGTGSAAVHAASLASAGTTVHAIGFAYDTAQNPVSYLDDIATAGGGNRYLADTASGLTTALNDIRSAASTSCSYQLDDIPDETRVWVSVGNTDLPRDDANGYEVHVDANVVLLNGTACSQAESGAAVVITTGCPVDCQPATEVCNYEDDDCDGTVDEGCESCGPEVCDGADNDCDGAIDEGCP